MSVRTETYMVYGLPLDVKKVRKLFENEELAEKLEFPYRGKGAKGKFGILYDVMSGNYAMAAYCIEVISDESFPKNCVNEMKVEFKIDRGLAQFIEDNNLIDLIPDSVREPAYYTVYHCH